MKPFRAILLLIFILCGASRCLALDGESVPRIPFPEIVRGNFSSLDIMPFRLRVVGTSYGEWADYTEKTVGNRSEEGFRTSLFGGTLGTDWLLSENCLVGFHAASGHVDINPEAAGYDGSITSVGGVARLSLSETRWYWDASLGVGRNRNRAESLLDGHLYAGNKDLTQVNYQTELGLKMSSGFTRIEPLVGFRYITLSAGGLNPYDPLSQSYLSTPESFRSLLGSRFAWEYATKISTIRPTLRGIWVHEFRDKTVFTSDDTFLFPIAGEFGGKMFPRDRAVLGAGVSAAMRDMVDLFFDYSCAFAPDNVSYSVSGGFHVKY